MEPIPKIELHRKALNKPYLYPDDKHVIALAEDKAGPEVGHPITCMDLNQPEEIAEFIVDWLKRAGEIRRFNRSG